MPVLPETFYFKGGPTAILLFHTFSSSPIDVRSFAQDLNKAGYTVLCPLFSGHGTDDPENVITNGHPDMWWEDALAAYQLLKRDGYSPIAVFGESLGGIFALKLMETFPEISCGGTISTPLFPVDKTHVKARFVERAQNWFQKEKLSPETIAERVGWLSEHISDQLQAISAYTVGIHDDLSSIKQPVFIAEGTADELLDPKINEQLATYLRPSTSVTLKKYEGAPHVITYSKYRQQLAADVIEFIKNKESSKWAN